MLHQQREDIDAVLAEIAFIERDCRRRLKLEAAPAGGTGDEDASDPAVDLTLT